MDETQIIESDSDSQAEPIQEDRTQYEVLSDLYTIANRVEHTVRELCPGEGDRAEFTIIAENDGCGYKYSCIVRLPDGSIIQIK
jgi:hypothetical protein